MGTAKFTTKAQELKQWCIDMHDKYSSTEVEARADTSFASEAQVEEPNDNTKTII